MTDDATRALRVLAALEQEHNEHLPDDRPLFAINSAMVLMGDVRAAKRALADVSRGTSVAVIDHRVNPDAWAEWLAYRRERNLPKYRERAADKLMAWLAEHTAVDQQAIVDQSIRNNWQGLFVLKGNGNGQGAGSRYDRLGREFEGKAASVLSLEPTAADVRQPLPRPVRHRAE